MRLSTEFTTFEALIEAIAALGWTWELDPPPFDRMKLQVIRSRVPGQITCPLCALAGIPGTNISDPRVEGLAPTRLRDRLVGAADNWAGTTKEGMSLDRVRLLTACGLLR